MALDRQLIDRLSTIPAKVPRICKDSGTPGASIAVGRRGDLIYQHHYGFRDVVAQKPPDEDTVYYIGSLSKGMAAAAVGILVDEEKLRWNTPLRQIFPEFRQRNKEIQDTINIADLLAHRSGLSTPNALWSQGGNKVYLRNQDILPLFAESQSVKDFRASFFYCNIGFWVIDEVIHKITNQSFGTFLEDRIFSPLSMNRTFIKATEEPVPNFAKAYMPLTDGTFVEIPPPAVYDGTPIAAAGGVKSSITDLVKYYSSLLEARSIELGKDAGGAIIKGASILTGAENIMDFTSLFEQSYGMGLARVGLPGRFGALGPNAWLVDNMPVIGEGSQYKLVIYHQGSYPGYLSSVFLVPEEDIVIVVLTNSLAFNDAADWLGQMVLEEVLDVPERTDFEKLVTESRDASLKQFSGLADDIRHHLDEPQAVAKVSKYPGVYCNSLRNFAINIIADEDKLQMHFQNESKDVYPLEYYGENTFSWAMPYNDQVSRGRWPISSPTYFQFKFSLDDAGTVSSLAWHHDPNIEPEVFTKVHNSASSKIQ